MLVSPVRVRVSAPRERPVGAIFSGRLSCLHGHPFSFSSPSMSQLDDILLSAPKSGRKPLSLVENYVSERPSGGGQYSLGGEDSLYRNRVSVAIVVLMLTLVLGATAALAK